MYDEERNNRRLYVASFQHEVSVNTDGDLIPKRTIYSAPTDTHHRTPTVWYMRPAVLLMLSVFLFATSIGTSVYSIFSGTELVAAPIATTDAFDPSPLQFGHEVEPFTPVDVAGTAKSLIASKTSFIDIDVPEGVVRVYEEGEEVRVVAILQTPAPDSRWYVPFGVYEATAHTKEAFSEFSNIYLPHRITFGTNHALNGIPYYPDQNRVPASYRGGGIRVSDADAEELYEFVTPGMAVIVRGSEPEDDTFVFGRKVPGMDAHNYLVADLESSTVLAASDLDESVPIASLTKLMTALIAAEHIDLDQEVRIRGSGVTSLIPRLREGQRASMYSLLQLLLVESSNEAAEVIASVVGRASFLELMNEKASEIGMEDTAFMDPSGLDDGNVSSVSDLFRLTQYISENRQFIFTLTAGDALATAYTDGQFGALTNFNTIEDLEFIAGKIGETQAAGQTSLTLHRLFVDGEARTIVIIVLGSADRTRDVERLVDLLYERFGSADE